MKPVFLATAALISMAATPALADSHTCAQLRLNVEDRVPAIARDLPYAALDCAGISEVFLLLVRSNESDFQVNQRIEAIFRRYGLVN